MVTTQNAPANATASKLPDFGNGRYSPLMTEVFNDSQHIFGIDVVKAEKLARQVSSDWGSAMKDRPVKVRMGKMNDDGKVTLREAAEIKGFTITLAITALRALNFANEAIKHGFNRNDTKWVMTDELASYVNSL